MRRGAGSAKPGHPVGTPPSASCAPRQYACALLRRPGHHAKRFLACRTGCQPPRNRSREPAKPGVGPCCKARQEEYSHVTGSFNRRFLSTIPARFRKSEGHTPLYMILAKPFSTTPRFGFHFLPRHTRLFFGQQFQLQIAQLKSNPSRSRRSGCTARFDSVFHRPVAAAVWRWWQRPWKNSASRS